MAPTPTPIPLQLPNSSSGRHLYRLHRQALDFSHHPLGQSSASRTQRHKPRIPDAAGGLQPSVSSTPELPQIRPWPLSKSAVIAPEPSTVPVGSGSKTPSQPGDLPGNIVAAVMVIVLILGGLIGLVIGGEMLRRQARSANKCASSPRTGFFTARKSKRVKNGARDPQQPNKTRPEKFHYDEKTLTRPLPVLKRERPRKLSAVWPIRGLSRALCNHRSATVQVERRSQYSPPVASPQTTWSEFTPVSLYVAPPRTVTILDRIPEECEEGSGSEAGASRASFQSDFLGNFDERESPRIEERCCRNVCTGGGKDEDSKSLGSSAPDMTTDGDESSRSSMVSLESHEDENDRESLKEVFELRRAQTTSMQMNKGVLLSLSLRTLDETKNPAPTDGGRPRSGSPGLDEDCVAIERELSLAILGGTFSAVDLDEFPSPPSMLPVIPSFVSGF